MAKWVLTTMEECADGHKSWYLNGKLHREDGPAIEYANGDKSWYLNGKRHREDGPAIECADGTRYWWLDGKEVTEEEVMGMAKWVLAEEGVRVDNTEDNVNSPSHYNQAGIECIDAIKASLGDGYQDYCKGNVMKYLWRYKYKNGIEDLKKAQWYLNSMADSLQEEEQGGN